MMSTQRWRLARLSASRAMAPPRLRLLGWVHKQAPAGRDGRGVAALLLALAAVASAAGALIAGFWQTPAGYSYHGFIMLSEDGSQYLAAIRQGAQGYLLYRDQFTTQPAPPIFMYPFYMIGGRLLAPLHLSPPVAFDVLHVVAAFSLVAALWVFARTFAPRHALTAYALMLFGGSLAVIPIALSAGRALLPYLTSELGTIQALLFSVHECAGLAAQALAVVAYRRLRGWPRAAALLVSLAILGCAYPFNLPIVLGAMVLDTLWAAVKRRRASRDDLLLLGLVAPLVSLFPVYYWVLFRYVPYWRASAFLHLDIAQPAVLLWTFGALALLALPRLPARSSRLLVLWLVVAVVFMLSRVAQPPRVLAGLWLPLAVLVAETLGQLRPRAARLALVCGLSVSGLLMPFFLSSVVAQNTGRFPIVQPAAVDGVGRYLARHATPNDVVMADYLVSNMLVGDAPMRVVAGHAFQTLDLATAGPAQERYPMASPLERRTNERRYGVTYIVVARTDRGLLAGLAVDARYRLRYANSAYRLYAVSPSSRENATYPPRLATNRAIAAGRWRAYSRRGG